MIRVTLFFENPGNVKFVAVISYPFMAGYTPSVYSLFHVT